jgi:hypothetical protein
MEMAVGAQAVLACAQEVGEQHRRNRHGGERRSREVLGAAGKGGAREARSTRSSVGGPLPVRAAGANADV